MEYGFLDKVENNTAILIYSEKHMEEFVTLLRSLRIQGDCLRAFDIPTPLKKLTSLMKMGR